MLLGESLPHFPKLLRDRVREGRTLLVQITGKDFGYDLQQWHDYLRNTGDGGYKWSNKHLGMPRRISEVSADAQWQETIKQLEKPDS